MTEFLSEEDRIMWADRCFTINGTPLCEQLSHSISNWIEAGASAACAKREMMTLVAQIGTYGDGFGEGLESQVERMNAQWDGSYQEQAEDFIWQELGRDAAERRAACGIS
ncbi:MAG: hypothetical protein R2707_02615 [Acidimicrobiales bacterium]